MPIYIDQRTIQEISSHGNYKISIKLFVLIANILLILKAAAAMLLLLAMKR